MILEESLNGGYGGLFGEVVTEDCYGMKSLGFVPDIIIDIGANIGVFSRFVRELFPKAKIISVEPDGMNREVFSEHTKDDNLVLIPKAIGVGNIWKYTNVANGAQECYFSSSESYPLKDGEQHPGVIQINWPTIMPDEIIKEYVKPNMKTVIKIDIEGAEDTIFNHSPSMEAIKCIDYICMEIHQFALNSQCLPAVKQRTFEALASFIPTHRCQWVNVMFQAVKR